MFPGCCRESRRLNRDVVAALLHHFRVVLNDHVPAVNVVQDPPGPVIALHRSEFSFLRWHLRNQQARGRGLDWCSRRGECSEGKKSKTSSSPLTARRDCVWVMGILGRALDQKHLDATQPKSLRPLHRVWSRRSPSRSASGEGPRRAAERHAVTHLHGHDPGTPAQRQTHDQRVISSAVISPCL